ncbi:MAG: HD domain-containing protein, partial [Peptostreptococcaceae bacterium]|nr:HD domain-containing protein [Peptostreptococcaceae bacterium]
KRAAELIIANKELAFQNGEKAERAAELIIANKELVFQNDEKEKRAAELVIANKELFFQNGEKDKRAEELIIANKELLIQKKNVEEQVKEISESQMATIFALVKLSESRDDQSGMHVKRVGVLCECLSRKLGGLTNYAYYINNDNYIENIYKASQLHDIGKVGIPDKILLKPGKLSPREFEVMKSHSIIGANTLREVQEEYSTNKFLNLGIAIAHFHHEKWDGTGYPDGLSGENIPLSARIMALVDVYDALRTKRPYKEAYSHTQSIDIIKNDTGHFDPTIIEVFIKNEEEFKNIYDKLVKI